MFYCKWCFGWWFWLFMGLQWVVLLIGVLCVCLHFSGLFCLLVLVCWCFILCFEYLLFCFLCFVFVGLYYFLSLMSCFRCVLNGCFVLLMCLMFSIVVLRVLRVFLLVYITLWCCCGLNEIGFCRLICIVTNGYFLIVDLLCWFLLWFLLVFVFDYFPLLVVLDLRFCYFLFKILLDFICVVSYLLNFCLFGFGLCLVIYFISLCVCFCLDDLFLGLVD